MTVPIIDIIKEEVSIYDLFEEAQPRIKYVSREKECQISCPFHGSDTAKSARVYPESNSLYCWTCGQSWDVIDFWAQLNEWWKNEKLDVGKAIADLVFRYNLESLRPTWRDELDKSLLSLARKNRFGYESLDLRGRDEAKLFYSWLISRKIQDLADEKRFKLWEEVKDCWDRFNQIDLSNDNWKQELDLWRISLRFLYS